MLKLLYVPVSPAILEVLRTRAATERRRPQDEAALIIERALQEPGRRVASEAPGQPSPAAEAVSHAR